MAAIRRCAAVRSANRNNRVSACMWDYKNYSELSNALGGLSAALGGLSQLFFYAKTKLGYLRTKPGHRGLNPTFVD